MPTGATAWLALALVAWLAWARLVRGLERGPRGDAESAVVVALVRLYVRLFHRLRVTGAEHVPGARRPGPLIVVANHTAGVDPLIVQSVCPFEVRWMMAADMRLPVLERLWSWARIISVEREGKDSRAARESLAHLRSGGVLGLFPEGGIERPPRRIKPFLGGVGMLVHRTRAPVLIMLIDGTPQVDPAWSSLWRVSASTLRILPVRRYHGPEWTSEAIIHDLHRAFVEHTGWPADA